MTDRILEGIDNAILELQETRQRYLTTKGMRNGEIPFGIPVQNMGIINGRSLRLVFQGKEYNQADFIRETQTLLSRRFTFKKLTEVFDGQLITKRRKLKLLVTPDELAMMKEVYRSRYSKETFRSKDGVTYHIWTNFGWTEGYKGEGKVGATQRYIDVVKKHGIHVDIKTL